MFRPMTRGCPYGSGCSTPSPGFDTANKPDRYEKGQPPGTESYVCSMEEIRTEVVSDKYTDEDNSDSFSELQGTILWPRRSYMYRVAFLCLMPAYGLFLFGFSCPFWMKLNQVVKHRGHYDQTDLVDVSIGLWRVCEGLDFVHLTDCTTLPKISSYTMACQAMLCLCLIFAFFSVVFGLYENCATRYEMDEGGDGRTRRPEVNAVVAGVFGMIGVSLYGVIIIGVAKDGKGGVHWAFPLTACAVTGVTICGILMAISNRIKSQPSYGGQVIGMACQNSPQSRDISMQDRLMSQASSLATPSPSANGNVATTYTAVIDQGPNATPMNPITRTESCLSSHMSSPDLFTSMAELDSASLSPTNQQTHVVETHDLYSRPANPVKKQMMLKRQTEAKAAQRRSWHFDDKGQGAYSVSDLINNPPGAVLPSVETKRKDGIKPPVPPRRDKMQPPPVGPNPLQPISDESNDLMLLEDPVVTIPSCSSKAPSDISESTDNSDLSNAKKRNTNPFLEDLDIYSGASNASDQNGVDSTELWQNQPWPEPPTENEILGETSTDNNAKGQGDAYCHSRSASNSNDVPEILQYQPQNSGSLSRTQSTHSRRGSSHQRKSDSPAVELGRKGSGERRPGSRRGNRGLEQQTKNKPDAQVPVRKEYDNPMFNRQSSPHLDSRGKPTGPPPAYDSTSFITPAPLTSAPPPIYAASIGRKDSFHSKQGQGHNTYVSNDTNTHRPTGHYDTFSQNPNRKQSLQQQSQSNKNSNGHPNKCSPKTKPKPPEKSRPRQIKREHNQRRTASGDSPVPRTPPPGYYSSNPDISRQSPGASPRVSRRRPDSMGRDEVPPVADDRNNYHPDAYNTASARQSPYFAKHPPWDSDL